MYKKCVSCYENHKTPSDKDCQNCNKELQQLYEENVQLKAENEKLKKEVSDLNFYIDNYKITWEIDKKEQYKQALEEVREIAYTTDFDIADIQKIVNEVLKNE